MNIYQANNLDFPDLLSRMGYEPAKSMKGGADLWYHSPFRTEKEPSFHIRHGDTYKWVWHDFGHGGTTILDFICEHENCTKKDALAFLRKIYPNWSNRVGGSKSRKKNTDQLSFLSSSPNTPKVSHSKPPVSKNTDEDLRDLEFVKDSPLQSPLIFTYLEGRRIPRSIAERYFRLIHYRNKKKATSKPYFAFGMRNINGGWECRSASDEPKMKFKSALLVRDIILVKGTQEGRDDVLIFEGMLDFASLLVLRGREQLKGDALILNGLSSYGRAKAYIEKYAYKRIHTFLDNNPSGQSSAQTFQEDFGDMAINQSYIFAPHVDLNDALKADHILNFTPSPEPPQP